MRQVTDRMLRAARLDATVYEEVEADPSATWQAVGVVVLSSLAGASRELVDAVIVNPYDRDEVADGIATAINMPVKERRERHAAMMAILRENDITAWRTRFVDALLKKCS